MRSLRLAGPLCFITLALGAQLGAQRTSTTPLDSSAGRIVFTIWESFADAAGRTRIELHARTEKSVRCYAPLGARVSARRDTILVDRWRLEDNHGICLDDSSENPSGIITFPLEEGRRVLAIAHLGIVDRYRLVVTATAIRVAPLGTPASACSVGAQRSSDEESRGLLMQSGARRRLS